MDLHHKTLLIDLDGTMYRGDEQIAGAKAFMDYVHMQQIAYVFVTNNAMRTHAQNRLKMEAMGFLHIRDYDFFTSAMAAAAYLRRLYPSLIRVFYIGQEGLREALEEQGFQICNEAVELVFIGLNRKACYADYSRAFYHLQKGARLVGTNPDRKLPHGDAFQIGNGAIIKMLEYASGQEAVIVGKPCAPMMEETLRYASLRAQDCLVIGDNLETDIAFGRNYGVSTLFVTTGVHDERDCERLGIHPDITVHDLRELIIK